MIYDFNITAEVQAVAYKGPYLMEFLDVHDPKNDNVTFVIVGYPIGCIFHWDSDKFVLTSPDLICGFVWKYDCKPGMWRLICNIPLFKIKECYKECDSFCIELSSQDLEVINNAGSEYRPTSIGTRLQADFLSIHFPISSFRAIR